MSTSPLFLLQFAATSFMRLHRVEFDARRQVIQVSGANAQGKSSVIRALEAALLGKRFDPEKPVHEGDAKAEVNVVVGPLDGEPLFRIERKWKAASGTTSLVVRDLRTETKRSSPQTILNDLVSTLAFDPLEFANPPGVKTPEAVRKRQVEMLLGIVDVPLDLDENAKEIRDAEHARRDLARDLSRAERRLADRTDPGEVEEPKSASEAEAEFKRLRDLDVAAASAFDYRQSAERDADMAKKKVDEAKRALERAEAEAEAAASALAEKSREYEEANAAAPTEEELNAARRAVDDLVAVNAEIAERQRERDRFVEARNERAKLEAAHDESNELVERLRAERAAAIEGAEFPVKGLGIDEDGVTLGGIPFSQASTAQRIAVSVRLAMAANPRLRLAIIRDGNALDETTVARLAEIAAEENFQLLLERVASDTPGCLVIEDGELVGSDG